jgi:hypothetical protein
VVIMTHVTPVSIMQNFIHNLLSSLRPYLDEEDRQYWFLRSRSTTDHVAFHSSHGEERNESTMRQYITYSQTIRNPTTQL